MAPRARLSRSGVTRTALDVIDDAGFDALSLSIVAEALGVRPSALYTHVDGLEGLRQAVAVESVRLLSEIVRDAAVGSAGSDALGAAAKAYRRYASEHPGRFTAALRAELDDDYTAADDELQGVFFLIHRAAGQADSDAALSARSARSAIHGFLAIEHSRGAGEHHDDEFAHLVAGLCATLPR